jgi:hypothetical protein
MAVGELGSLIRFAGDAILADPHELRALLGAVPGDLS